jgi:hypothetical protein
MPQPVGIVSQLRRHPVKSVVGEVVEAVRVDARGVVGDRVWAVYTDDGRIGSGKDSRRFRRVDGLLQLQATLDGDRPRVHLPDGRAVDVGDPDADSVLSEVLGRPVQLRAEADVPHFDDSPLHLVTTTALRTLGRALDAPVDVARFRPNLVVDTLAAGLLDGHPDDGWTGRRLAVGAEVVLEVEAGMPRCVMVDAPQRGLPAGGGVLKTLGRVHDVEFGVQASVVRAGTVRHGDEVRLLP